MKPIELFRNYANQLSSTLQETDLKVLEIMAEEIQRCHDNKKTVFICGNGGSAGNAIHLANDFIYGITKKTGKGLRINALPSNQAVLTCLANDIGYDSIYSEQIAVLGEKEDILIVLSGSGNSKNILKAIEQANSMGIFTFAILGFDGGIAKKTARASLHFNINDMQISEDLQLISGHMIMQLMYSKNKINNIN
jgi:D-sedoheptulose 7-phosphate isomerase